MEEIAKAGIKAIIQPGGSVRDQESIEAADKHGLTMIFTGVRHFRHPFDPAVLTNEQALIKESSVTKNNFRMFLTFRTAFLSSFLYLFRFLSKLY